MALKKVWWGADLPNRMRECKWGTYDPFEDVPRLAPSEYADLKFLDNTIETIVENDKNTERMEVLLQQFPNVPKSFARLMTSSTLLDCIPSCTACYYYFGLPYKIHQLDMTILMFYRDQQGCLTWYLVLYGKHAGKIIASRCILGTRTNHDRTPEDLTKLEDHFWICAGSFDEFIYRLWIENHWYMQTPAIGVLHDAIEWYKMEYTKLAKNGQN